MLPVRAIAPCRRFVPHLRATPAQLEFIDLTSNRITNVPRAVAYMPKLRSLGLQGNPLVFPPPGVLSQGDAALLDFIK